MVTISLIKEIDVNLLYELIDSNRSYLKKDFPVTVASVTRLKGCDAFIKEKIKNTQCKTEYFFLIKFEQKCCGVITIKNIDWRTPKAEIAYFVDENMQGKEIVAKAINQIINFSFDELQIIKLYACVNPENIRSKKVLIKNGFIKEGLLRNNFRDGFEKLCDFEYYTLLKLATN